MANLISLHRRSLKVAGIYDNFPLVPSSTSLSPSLEQPHFDYHLFLYYLYCCYSSCACLKLSETKQKKIFSLFHTFQGRRMLHKVFKACTVGGLLRLVKVVKRLLRNSRHILSSPFVETTLMAFVRSSVDTSPTHQERREEISRDH